MGFGRSIAVGQEARNSCNGVAAICVLLVFRTLAYIAMTKNWVKANRNNTVIIPMAGLGACLAGDLQFYGRGYLVWIFSWIFSPVDMIFVGSVKLV